MGENMSNLARLYNKDKQLFYFTFGSSDTMPYYNGWVEVWAETYEQACEKFIKRFGATSWGTVNCSFIYYEQEFLRTCMNKEGNLGARCHEVIA
jgi:hypothetical protein